MHRMRHGGLIAGHFIGIVLCSAAVAAPNPPSNLVATAMSYCQVNLSWTDNSNDEDGFKIERSTDGTNFTQIAQVLSNSTSYGNVGLFPGVTYHYRARAYNAAGNSGFSNVAGAITPILCTVSLVGWGDNSSGQLTAPSGLTEVAAIKAGLDYNLALKSNGTVIAWGRNDYGQTNVPPGLTGVVAVAAGGFYNLALKSNGAVVGWGWNDYGQTTPPAGLTNAVAIGAGFWDALALKSDGSVVGWGISGDTTPVGLKGIVAIAKGSDTHSLGLKSDGTVIAWGQNSYGQATTPPGLTGVVAIAAGDMYNLALKSDGTVVGWGFDAYGQATPPAGLTGVVAIAAGDYHALALKSDGTVVGWGDDFYGAETPPTNLANVVQISGGYAHSLAMVANLAAPTSLVASVLSSYQVNLTWTFTSCAEQGFKIERAFDSGGVATGWVQVATVPSGFASYNDFGLTPGTKYWYRVRAYNSNGDSPYSNATAISLLPFCASSLVAWGNNTSGQSTPPAGLTNIAVIAAGRGHSLAVKTNGTVVGWGDNSFNQANPPAGLTGVVVVAAGGFHSLALKRDSTVAGWGDNNDGQTTPPSGLAGVVAVSAGGFHSLALKADGTVVGWGYNGSGQASPPAGLTGVVAIAASWTHSLALKSDGTVVGWGFNGFGQTSTPSGVTAVAIATGEDFSLALKRDGTVVAWGDDSYGQTDVPPGLTGVVAIGASCGGGWHCVALKADGTLVGWGNNSYQQATPPAGLMSVPAFAVGAFHTLALSCGPSAPSSLTSTLAVDHVNLAWHDNSNNEARFGIERSPASTGPWTEIDSVLSNVVGYSDFNISCGQTYYYRVRAYLAANGSPYSNTAQANTENLDADTDGIPDCWLLQYFGHPTGQAADRSRASDDADGDGFTNVQEYLAGTNPTNSASSFRITSLVETGHDILVAWTTGTGKTNALQTVTGNIGSYTNSFTTIFTVINTAGTVTNYLDIGAATNAPGRFYRVRLVP